jgi:hypothetical protein
VAEPSVDDMMALLDRLAAERETRESAQARMLSCRQERAAQPLVEPDGPITDRAALAVVLELLRERTAHLTRDDLPGMTKAFEWPPNSRLTLKRGPPPAYRSAYARVCATRKP